MGDLIAGMADRIMRERCTVQEAAVADALQLFGWDGELHDRIGDALADSPNGPVFSGDDVDRACRAVMTLLERLADGNTTTEETG